VSACVQKAIASLNIPASLMLDRAVSTVEMIDRSISEALERTAYEVSTATSTSRLLD
jgi:hypothetical protein